MQLISQNDSICDVAWEPAFSSGGHTLLLSPGVRYTKYPKTLRARKAIRKTPTRLFCKVGLFTCCKGNQN